MSDLTSLFTDTLAKFSFRAVLSAAATLLICLVAVHLLGKLLRRLLARTKLDERIQKYLLARVTPRDPTDSSATREVMGIFRLSATISTVTI